MHLKLSMQQTEELLKLSETGMGYQYVNVTLKKDNLILRNVVVLNAEELILPDQYINLQLDDIAKITVAA